MRVLYVEDEKHLARAVAQVLKKQNYAVDLAYDGDSGLDQALTDIYDFIILDIMLPRLDGIEVLREIRRAGIETPVILLTARGELEDKIMGLDSGADDYLPKPFQTEELLARLRALGRRRGQLLPDNLLRFGDIELNRNTLDLSCQGRSFHLTMKESQVLELLIMNHNALLPAETIIDRVWGYETDAENSHVRVHMAFLRKKLALLESVVSIQSVRGAGYRLVVQEGGGSDVQAAEE